MPLPEVRARDETFQTLVDSYFIETTDVACQNNNCNGRIRYTNAILDPKSAIVFYLDRTRVNRNWANAPRGQSGAYATVKDNRKVTLQDVIYIPKVGGGHCLYRLVALVEHKGEHGKGGHYVSHLKFNREWYLANDDLPMQRSDECRDFDVERSCIFIYTSFDPQNTYNNAAGLPAV